MLSQPWMLNILFSVMQYLIVFQENIVRTFTYKKSYATEGKENGKENFCCGLS